MNKPELPNQAPETNPREAPVLVAEPAVNTIQEPVTPNPVPPKKHTALILVTTIATIILILKVFMFLNNQASSSQQAGSPDSFAQELELAEKAEGFNEYALSILPLFEKGNVPAIKAELTSQYPSLHPNENVDEYLQSVVDSLKHATPEDGSSSSIEQMGDGNPVLYFNKYYKTTAGRMVLEYVVQRYDGRIKMADVIVKRATAPSGEVDVP